MLTLTTDIEIDAPPARVWAVLTDFAAYPQWNPFVTSIEGRPVVGERLSVFIRPPGRRGMRFRPTVLVAEPERELRWLGRLLLPGVFDGEHFFRLEPLAGRQRVRFVHGERFSGLLVPLFKKSLETGTRAGFEAMNRALKARVESGVDARVEGRSTPAT